MSKVFVLFSGSRRCWRSIIFVCNWQVLNAVFDSFFSLSSSSFYYYYYNARLVSYFIVMLLFLLLFNLFKSALKWIKLDLTNKWRLVDSIRGRNLSCAFAGPDRRIPRCQLSVTRKPFQAKPLLPLFYFTLEQSCPLICSLWEEVGAHKTMKTGCFYTTNDANPAT